MLLFAILAFGLLTMWVPSRWPLTAFELAILSGTAWQILRRRLAFSLDTGLLAVIILWGAIQLLAGWSVDPFRTQEELLFWTVRLCGFAWAVSLSDLDRNRALTSSIVLATGLAIVGMLTVFSSPPGTVFWLTNVGTDTATLGPFVYRNQFAAFVEALLPLVLLRSFTHPTQAWLYTSSAGLLVASVVASGSRAGTLLCVAEIILVPLLFALSSSKEKNRRMPSLGMFLGLIIPVVLLTGIAGWSSLASRFDQANPYALRWNLAVSSFEMFKVRWLTGWGLGTWSQVYPGFALFDDGNFVNQAHNEWVQWADEGGIALVLLMLLFTIRLLRPAIRTVWGVGALAVLLHAFVDYPFEQRPALASFFFVLFGFVLSSGRRPTLT